MVHFIEYFVAQRRKTDLKFLGTAQNKKGNIDKCS